MINDYRLQNGAWTCCISSEYGINVTSLRHHDFPLLREPQTEDALRADPVLYGIPLLLPPNRTAGGTFVFDGKTYSLLINEPLFNNHLHGLLYHTPFHVLEYSGCCLTSEFINHGEVFPFPFRIEVKDSLDTQGYRRILKVTNTGDTAMPLTLGFHTTFTESPYFSVPVGKRWIVNEAHIPTGEMADLTPEEQTYRNDRIPKSGSISGFFKAKGKTARIGKYAFTADGFDQWILYNGGGSQGYLCIEPQSGPVNALGSGVCRRLESGESALWELSVTAILSPPAV